MQRLRDLLEAIKFEHTVFALPFALLSMFLAAQGWPETRTFAWVVLAMVAARSTAMMMNRIADRRIDAANPRTSGRHLVTGSVSLRDAWIFTLLNAALFLLASYQLNALTFKLAPIALAILWSYSWSKRFTWAAHLWLGVALGLAPLGAWIATAGHFDSLPILLGLGVVFWVAGFDTIYSCQDADFDRQRGLYSLPARLGIRRALHLARWFHVVMLAIFVWIGLQYDFGWLYALGLILVAALVVVQHALVDASDLRHIDVAFFNVNSIVGVLVMAFTLADRLLLG